MFFSSLFGRNLKPKKTLSINVSNHRFRQLHYIPSIFYRSTLHYIKPCERQFEKKGKIYFLWFTIDVLNEKEADYHFEFGEEDYEDDYDEEYYDENGEILKK